MWDMCVQYRRVCFIKSISNIFNCTFQLNKTFFSIQIFNLAEKFRHVLDISIETNFTQLKIKQELQSEMFYHNLL